jgi:hypothetical protein
MTYFLRDLPTTIQLLPENYLQHVINFEDKVCTTLYFKFKMKSLDERNVSISSNRSAWSGKKPSFILGYEIDFVNENINLNYLGSLFVLYFFNAVYTRFPTLAIQAIKQAYFFNYNFTGIAILQALHRLAYAYFGLNYEDYRNHENIKTRSVIEDFHSILGSILVLPEMTMENEDEIWSFSPYKGIRENI